jgi:hypothetical protein
MRRLIGLPVLLGVLVGLATLLGSSGGARAADPSSKPNACGCHQTGSGMCICDRKAKCGCPGECEPKGCEEKRVKQLESEIRAETKKAQEAGKRQRVTSEEKEASPRKGGGKTAASAEEAAPAARGKMSKAQRRELGRLLDAYLDENPGARSKTVGEARLEIAK